MTLTREEILAKEPGPEFNRLIARELFKASIISKPSALSDKTFYLLIAGEDFNPIEKGKNLGNAWWRLSEEQTWEACPKYSTDISAAWEIVEHMKKRHFTELAMIELDDGSWGWMARFILAEGEPHWTKGYRVCSKTAPEAICKAALRAVMNV